MASLNYDEAAHLLRRAGFGGTPDEIEALTSKGREGAVDYLLNYTAINNQAMESLLQASFDFSDPTDNQKLNNGEIRRWWFTRMVATQRQFEEKMTLFWHNHFATASSKVQDIYLYIQNLKLRANALGRFDDILLTVAQDPAMLIWLDGVTNVLGKPNENFGRELQELFTMGINDVVTGEANYTEDDVKQIARAFTGWNFQRAAGSQYGFNFRLIANQHDNGAKTIYAGTPYQVSGNLSGEDVITVIANRAATARYLTWKLWNFFVYPLTTSNADKTMIDKFSKVYLNNNHSIKELVRAIFTSDEFFSERAIFSLVKQPAELVVGAVRMLGATYQPGSTLSDPPRTSNALANGSRNMGQDLFNPPDVAGWDFNLGWVNTASMLERFNYTNQLVTTRNTTNPGVFVTTDQLRKYIRGNPKKTVNAFLSTLNLPTTKPLRNPLMAYLTTGDAGQTIAFATDDAYVDKKIRGLVHQIMCLPEFQLN
jgi:uncharacterized protein (DUF1800 family)